jgi:hypothetical protein
MFFFTLERYAHRKFLKINQKDLSKILLSESTAHYRFFNSFIAVAFDLLINEVLMDFYKNNSFYKDIAVFWGINRNIYLNNEDKNTLFRQYLLK